MKEFIQSLNNAFLKDSVARVTGKFIRSMAPEELDKDEVWDIFGSYVPAFYAGSVLMFITVVIMQFVITSANKEKARIESELALQQEIA